MTNKRAAILAEADALEIAGRQAFADLIAEMNRHRALDISARLWPPSERCKTIEIAEQFQQPFLALKQSFGQQAVIQFSEGSRYS